MSGDTRMEGGGRRATERAGHGRPDAEPTLFELSQPGRSSWQLRTTGMPEWDVDELVPAATGARRRCRWPRSPNVISWATSPV